MKNITSFNEFKKLNEAGFKPDTGGYGNAVDTNSQKYFTNVKSNMAGAENTLIGSSIMRIFGFIKRKAKQGILLLYYNALKREYLGNIIRYCIKNGIQTTNPDETYIVKQVEDLEGNEVSSTPDIKVKLTNDNKALLSFYNVGSSVNDLKNEPLPDGVYYNTNNNSNFTIKSGVITDIKLIAKNTTASTSGSTATTTTTAPPTSNTNNVNNDEIKANADIQNEVNGIQNRLSTFSNKSNDDIQFMNQKKNELNSIIDGIKKGSITEIDNLLKHKNISNIKKGELEYDKKLCLKNIEVLSKSIKEIDNKLAGVVNQPKSTTSTGETNKTNDDTLDFSENYDFDEDDEILNEAINKVGVDRKVGDELSAFQANGIKFYKQNIDEQYIAKQFESKEAKQGVTNVVLENKSPIIKIQLAAERLYLNGNETEQKLKNSWDQMVESAKGLYSRYMFVDQVDPRTLKSKISADDVNKLSDKLNNDPNSIYNKSKDLEIKAKIDQNPNIGLKERKFSANNKTFGILSTKDGSLMYCQDNMNIDGSKYYSYRIFGTVDMNKLVDDKTSENLSQYVSFGKLPQKYLPKNQMVKANGAITMKFHSTYIISNKGEHLNRGLEMGVYNTNHINILFLYTTDENITKLTPDDFNKKYTFYIRDNKGFDHEATIKEFLPQTTQFYFNDIDVNVPYPIPQQYEKKYGLTDNMRYISLSDIVDKILGLVGIKKNKK